MLGQLGNRVQHALRAFTPRDQKAVKAAAETFRSNPKLDVEKAITELGTGEALVSFLEAKGAPSVVERAFVLPPHSQIGPITADERNGIINKSALFGQYEELVDRESAYEKLKNRAAEAAAESAPAQTEGGLLDKLGGLFGGGAPAAGKGRAREGILEAATKSAARAVGSQLGRQILRGVLGGILGGGTRRR